MTSSICLSHPTTLTSQYCTSVFPIRHWCRGHVDIVVLMLRPEALNMVYLQLHKECISQCSRVEPLERAKLSGIITMNSDLTVSPYYYTK